MDLDLQAIAKCSFVVGIPVVNSDLADMLLASMEKNTMMPRKVLIVDNTEEAESYKWDTDRFVVEVHKFSERLGVNASWNYIIKHAGKCDFLSILNDDIVLGKFFFERTAKALLDKPRNGVACPRTVSKLHLLKAYEGQEDELWNLKRRQGWAFTIKKKLLRKIPPIPTENMETFGGDDWIFHHCRELGYRWVIGMGNYIFHHGGVSVKKFGLRGRLNMERFQMYMYTDRLGDLTDLEKTHPNIVKNLIKPKD